MTAGRPPLPTEIKALRGNPGKRPLNNDPHVPAGIPKCPDWLTPVAKAEWARVVPIFWECASRQSRTCLWFLVAILVLPFEASLEFANPQFRPLAVSRPLSGGKKQSLPCIC